ncbi:MAG: hypothetical protein K2P84_05550 [Undibacterium sp.]|nr:hypothetical protein [Undibacterium sp.]
MKIYEYTAQPPYWIVQDDDGCWLVPARNQGWQEREMFVGRVLELREVSDLQGVDLGLVKIL